MFPKICFSQIDFFKKTSGKLFSEHRFWKTVFGTPFLEHRFWRHFFVLWSSHLSKLGRHKISMSWLKEFLLPTSVLHPSPRKSLAEEERRQKLNIEEGGKKEQGRKGGRLEGLGKSRLTSDHGVQTDEADTKLGRIPGMSRLALELSRRHTCVLAPQ